MRKLAQPHGASPPLPQAQPAAGAGLRAVGREKLPVAVGLYVCCVILPLTFGLGPLNLTNLRLLLILLVVPLYVNILLGKYGRVYLTDIVFPLFIGWSFLSLLQNNPNMAIENAGSSGVEFLGGYAVGRAFVRTREHYLRLVRLLLMVVLIFFPFAVMEAVTGKKLLLDIMHAIPGAGSVAYAFSEPRFGLDRVQMAFTHPIHFGLFCSVAVPMAFVALKSIASDGARWAFTFLVGASAFLSLSSGAFLAVVLQVGLIAWAAMFVKLKWKWWLLLGVLAAIYIVIDILSNRSPIRVFLHYATFSAHTAYWRALIFEWGMVNVWANPFYGLGFNDWVRPRWMYSGSMDNFWLVVAVRHGIPAFLLIAVGVLIPIYRILRRDYGSDTNLNNIRLSWMITMIALIFTLCTVHVWHNIYSFVFFLFGAGIWLVAADSNDDGETNALPEDEAPPQRVAYYRLSNRPKRVSPTPTPG